MSQRLRSTRSSQAPAGSEKSRCGMSAAAVRYPISAASASRIEHRGERQGDERHLVAEERHGLAEPEVAEVRPPEEPHAAGSTVSGLRVRPSPCATATRCPAKCSATGPFSLPGMERPWRIESVSSSLRPRSGSDTRAASGARTFSSSASSTPNGPTAVRLIVRQCPPRWSAIARMYVPLETFRSSSTSGGSVADDAQLVDRGTADRHLDGDAAPLQPVGALALDLDRGGLGHAQLDLALERLDLLE